MTEALNFQQKSLQQQGYGDYSSAQLNELSWGLRFTPTVCMLGALYGLYSQNPQLHFALAVLGILPFWFPAWHPLDLFYNHALRPMWGGVKLPPNPLPRRIACFMGGAMNIGIGLSFLNQNVTLAYAFGATLVVLQLIVNTTHFCLASWMYEMALKAVGMWEAPLTSEKAKEMVAQGAMLLDVREPHEFAKGHIDEAVNIPLSQLQNRVSEVKGPVVCYCLSGMRSAKAVSILQKNGVEEAHNLGAMSRWSGGCPIVS